MSQIFISYANEDRNWVESFARTLEKQGWSVWWDRHTPTGQVYDKVIWDALQAATCVVVVWSGHSIDSEWVKEEASDAKKRNILLPVRIDEARPPFGFSRRQTQSLVGWQDGLPHRGYDQLLTDIASMLQAPVPLPSTVHDTPTPVLSPSGSATLARIHGYLWLIVPTLLLLVAVVTLMAWRVPTHVQLDLTVNRLEFTVGRIDGGSMSLLGPIEYQTLTIREFSRIQTNPKILEIADPRLYDFDRDTYPASAWHQVATAGRGVEFVAGEASRHPSMTLRGESTSRDTSTTPAGRLDSLAIEDGARVTLERARGSGGSLSLDIGAERPRALLTPAPMSRFATRHTTLEGSTLPGFAQPDGQTYRLVVQPSQPIVEVDGGAHALALTVRPISNGDHFKVNQAIPITAIDFSQQSSTGSRMTSLADGVEAVLRYPQIPDLPGVKFAAPDFLGLEELERFVIKALEWSPTGDGIRLTLDGVAGHVATRSGDFQRDHRLTQFETLRHNPSLMTVLAILGWIVPTLIGARKLYKELR
ncbi:hypothetical protein YTPLAS18_00540 [Nitrospira sp.]|nr:hypothetical protein YTPLAS18_00540 [Nitrospira sp.]